MVRMMPTHITQGLDRIEVIVKTVVPDQIEALDTILAITRVISEMLVAEVKFTADALIAKLQEEAK